MIPEVLFKAMFALFSAVIALLDIRKGELPRVAFIIVFPVFLVCKVMLGRFPLLESTTGFLIALTIFLLAFFISGGKLGLADVWYSALTGMVLGPCLWYGAIGLACAGAIIVILVSGRRRIPFLPLMAFGSITMIISIGLQR